MYERTSSDGSCSRRRLLAAAGLVGATALAGCTGDGPAAAEGNDGDSSAETDGSATTGDDTPDSVDGNAADSGDDGDAGTGACDLGGAPTAFDPGDQSFPFDFERPDTWERYSQGVDESESGVLALLGHADSRTSGGSYPVNMVVSQHKAPTTDDETATNWATAFGTSERIDWTFAFEGEEIEIYESAVSDEEAKQWSFLLPARGREGVYGVTVQFMDDRRESTCMDEVTAIARTTIESLRPNPDYSP